MDQPLAGRTIVITRAASQANELIATLESYGAKVIACPTIEITEPESYQLLDEAIDHLYGYDWLLFTSTNGVDFFLRRLVHLVKSVADLDDLRVCAIGEATAERLQQAHIHVDIVPTEAKAEGVFAALVDFVGGRDKLVGLNFLLPRAAVARDFLPNALTGGGARVDAVPAYRTVIPADLDRGRMTAMLAGSADCIVFTSPSTVKNLALLFDTFDLSTVLTGVNVACIGEVTANAASEYGLKVAIQPSRSNAATLGRAIADYYAES